MNPHEPLKTPEHIPGFEKDVFAPTPEKLRKAGFKAFDVICWVNKEGLVAFQNGEEYFRLARQWCCGQDMYFDNRAYKAHNYLCEKCGKKAKCDHICCYGVRPL